MNAFSLNGLLFIFACNLLYVMNKG